MNVAEQIEVILSNKKKYLNIKEYEQITQLINSNKADLFFVDPKVMVHIDSVLYAYLNDSEMYYSFTKNQALKFVKRLNKIGYACKLCRSKKKKQWRIITHCKTL